MKTNKCINGFSVKLLLFNIIFKVMHLKVIKSMTYT